MKEFLTAYGSLLQQGVADTIYMVLSSTVLAYVLGLPMGVLLYATKSSGILENKAFNSIFGWAINILRSIPFIILMVTISPFTRLLVGKAIGSGAAVVPLTVGACPFVARMVETSLEEIDHGVIEACQCMGASPLQIITKVLISESFPSIIRGFSITTITLIGYCAIAGAVGAGGLGDIAIRYGYIRGKQDVMYATLIITIILVCIIQLVFDKLAQKADKKKLS